MKKRKDPVETMWVTRAEFEAEFGHRPSKDSVGVMIYNLAGEPLVQCMFAEPDDEIATLEKIWEAN